MNKEIMNTSKEYSEKEKPDWMAAQKTMESPKIISGNPAKENFLTDNQNWLSIGFNKT